MNHFSGRSGSAVLLSGRSSDGPLERVLASCKCLLGSFFLSWVIFWLTYLYMEKEERHLGSYLWFFQRHSEHQIYESAGVSSLRCGLEVFLAVVAMSISLSPSNNSHKLVLVTRSRAEKGIRGASLQNYSSVILKVLSSNWAARNWDTSCPDTRDTWQAPTEPLYVDIFHCHCPDVPGTGHTLQAGFL